MAVKSIIDVQVNDGAFAKFAAMFQRYQAQLPAAASAWKATNTQLTLAGAAAGVLNTRAALVNVATKTGVGLANQYSAAWRNLAQNSLSFYKNVQAATSVMLKWAGLTGALGGLLGGGSLFGLEHLAAGVGRGRRDASGLGTTFGGQAAFENAFNRFNLGVDTLGNIADILSGPRRWMLQGKVSPDVLATNDPAKIAASLIPAAEAFAKAHDPRSLQGGILAGALGWKDLLGLPALTSLRSALPGETAGRLGQYGVRSGQFARDPQTEKTYQDFNDIMHSAGVNIENVFVNKLAELTPALGRLSDKIVDIVVRFSDSVKPDTIRLLGEGIDKFAAYLGSDDFAGKMKTFASALGAISDSVVALARKLGLAPGATAPAGTHPITFQESLKLGSGGAGAYFRGDLVDDVVGGRVPLPRARPPERFMSGRRRQAVGENDPSRVEVGRDSFADRFSAVNMSSQEVTLTVRSPTGGSTPRSVNQVGAGQ